MPSRNCVLKIQTGSKVWLPFLCLDLGSCCFAKESMFGSMSSRELSICLHKKTPSPHPLGRAHQSDWHQCLRFFFSGKKSAKNFSSKFLKKGMLTSSGKVPKKVDVTVSDRKIKCSSAQAQSNNKFHHILEQNS